VEKEACAIVEAIRKWAHLLSGHQPVSVIYDVRHSIKIKNEKIIR